MDLDTLYGRHQEYLRDVPESFERGLACRIDWDSPLLMIRGPKGVGKSTLIQQHILKEFGVADRHVLYCSADSGYFTTHTLVETADEFVRHGGEVLAFDEIHKYRGWSSEIKEIHDLHKRLKLILSGSSLIQLNDGQADLSRRADVYDMAGLSFREYLYFVTGHEISPVTLEELLSRPVEICSGIRKSVAPLEHFGTYLRMGYYPYALQRKRTYSALVENTVNYVIDNELPSFRGVEVSNTRKLKALLQVISETKPYEVEMSKLSRSVSIDRVTLPKYMKYLEEACILRRLFAELDNISDLQKPDKLLFDNPNLMYVLSPSEPLIGTVRECFFCNQLASSGHRVEYGGLKTGDFRIDRHTVIEVGGPGKDFSQINPEDIGHSAIAVDAIDIASPKRIPLWSFGFLY